MDWRNGKIHKKYKPGGFVPRAVVVAAVCEKEKEAGEVLEDEVRFSTTPGDVGATLTLGNGEHGGLSRMLFHGASMKTKIPHSSPKNLKTSQNKPQAGIFL